jgi:hypothetical protein
MTLKIYSYLDEKRSTLGDVPRGNEFYSICPPVKQTPPETSLFLGWEELHSQFTALRASPESPRYIGFENASRPLFLDPMKPERLRADHPTTFDLREKYSRDWRVSQLRVSAEVLKNYEAMRMACDDAEYARLMRWLGRVDAVVPHFQNGLNDRLRQAQLGETWDLLTIIIRQTGVFKNIPEQFFTVHLWPWFNSFIIRSDLFEEFFSASFESFLKLRENMPDVSLYATRFLMERLLGVFLQYRSYSDTLFRLAELPLLHLLPESPPESPPDGFDPKIYLKINSDVASAGIGAEQHYLSHGWREGREWA